MKEVYVKNPINASIIEPRAYSNKNLLELIKILGDSDTKISLEEMEMLIADLIVKYLMMYLLCLDAEKVIPLEDVNVFYGWMCVWSRFGRENRGKAKLKYPSKIGYFFKSFEEVALSANLISDVASTTALFREIIMAQIHPLMIMKGKHVSIDLGTGSGILMLAMHIQAMRNKCRDVTTLGIEKHQTTATRAGNILKKLDIPFILRVADTTQIGEGSLFHDFRGIMPACFCNETIPIDGAPFHADGYTQEPFFANHKALQRIFGNQLYFQSLHFPYRVDVILSNGAGQEQEIMASQKNSFHGHEIGKGGDNIGAFLSPKNIQLSATSQLTSLSAVGDELRQKTWDPTNPRRIIPANPDARFRWMLPKDLDTKFPELNQ